MAMTRCTVRRRQKPPYQRRWTDYHVWTDGTGRCFFCHLSLAEANSAPEGPPYRLTIDQVHALKDKLRAAKLELARLEHERIAGKRRRGWIANALNERERRAREKITRNTRG